MGGRLGTAQVRRVDHSTDRRPRGVDRRRGIQAGRCAAGPHSDLTEGPTRNSGLGKRQPAAGRRRAGSHRAPVASGARTAATTPSSPSTTRPAPTLWRRSGSSRTRARSWSARTPAATRSVRLPTPRGTVIPVHRYLLVDQGVHLGEFHYLEELSRSKTYVFCYVAAVNKIKGTAAGFALRPLALR